MRRILREKCRREEFARLATAHRAALVACARRMVGESDAEDVLQAALTAAWGRFVREAQIHSARAWLLCFVVHESQNVLGRRSRGPAREVDVYEAEPASTLEDVLAALQSELEYEALRHDPADLFERLDEKLASALRSLSQAERVTFLLRAVGELAYREVADVLGIPVGTVMSRLCRAREKLRVRLRRDATAKGTRGPGSALEP